MSGFQQQPKKSQDTQISRKIWPVKGKINKNRPQGGPDDRLT